MKKFPKNITKSQQKNTVKNVYSPTGCETYPVAQITTVSTVGAGDNFNAGYIYAKLRGIDDQSSRIAMAQRWSQDVCQQLGNNISDALVAQLQV